MRGSRAILALAALVLVLGATTLWAQDTYAMPLDRSINPGRTSIKYDTHIYTFICRKHLQRALREDRRETGEADHQAVDPGHPV